MLNKRNKQKTEIIRESNLQKLLPYTNHIVPYIGYEKKGITHAFS